MREHSHPSDTIVQCVLIQNTIFVCDADLSTTDEKETHMSGVILESVSLKSAAFIYFLPFSSFLDPSADKGSKLETLAGVSHALKDVGRLS